MTTSKRRSALLPCLAFAGLLVSLPVAGAAQGVFDRWASVAIPPPPSLQTAVVDANDTALLMLDFSVETCSQARRPSCVTSIAPVAGLLASARAHHMMVVYSTGGAVSAKTPDSLTPLPGEPSVRSGVDKFIGTDLEKLLSDRKIHSVIVVGTSAQGAVLYTASEAALRGMQAIVPVDGFSADTPFAELYTAWHLKNAPASVSAHVTLTRASMITFR